jgi:hypothetical protein
MSKEELNQLMQSKEEVKVILYTDSSSVGLCYKFDTFDELVKLIKNQNEEKTNELSEEDINNLNRISTILVEAGRVQNWWKEERLIAKEESDNLCNWLKSFYNKIR